MVSSGGAIPRDTMHEASCFDLKSDSTFARSQSYAREFVYRMRSEVVSSSHVRELLPDSAAGMWVETR